MKHIGLAVVIAVGLTACASQDAGTPVGGTGGGWTTGQTSIAYLPAPGTVATTTIRATNDAGGPPQEAALQQIRPGEVWCKVIRPATYDERTEREVICGPHWEWRRTSECDVPGAQPSQTWCYIQVPATYRTRTSRVMLCPEHVEWRRTSECDVPAPR
jgi:hypothetical protein